MPRRSPPETEEGWFVSHLIFAVRRRPEDDPEQLRERAARQQEHLREFAATDRFELVRIVSDRADFMTLYMAETLEELEAFQRPLLESKLGGHLNRLDSFLSVTETSLYRTPKERAEEALRDEDVEPGTDAYDERRGQIMKRLEKYRAQRLHPALPEMDYVTFYPMKKRRRQQANWYQLPTEQRAEMMASHGTIGRRYAGDVRQIITSAVGLDDWEWGVTLYAHDPVMFKRLVYEMRFDEVSARYSDFGPFYTGYRLEPDQFAELF